MKKRYDAWVDSAPTHDEWGFMTGHGFAVLASFDVIVVLPVVLVAVVAALVFGSVIPLGISLVWFFLVTVVLMGLSTASEPMP